MSADRNILLSIITPFFNQDLSVFQGGADSVLAEMKRSAFNWEWIIVMHNTTTCSPEDVRAVCDRDEHVRILELKNELHTPCSPRNMGIDHAVGKYLYFLDDDDVLEPGFLSRAVPKMEEEQLDILVGAVEKEMNDDSLFMVPLPLIYPDVETGYLVPKNDPDQMGWLMYGAPMMLAAKVMRGDIIRERHIRFDTEVKIFEDVYFNAEVYAHSEKISVVTSWIAYTYRQRGDSLLQKLLKEDSFTIETYMEPIRKITSVSLANGISPSAFLWDSLGMITMIYTKGGMSAEKKKQLFDAMQKYIPYLKFDFNDVLSKHCRRKEILVGRRMSVLETEEKMKGLRTAFPKAFEFAGVKEEPVVFWKDISYLEKSRQETFTKGFRTVLEQEGKRFAAAAFVLNESETMVILRLQDQLAEAIGTGRLIAYMKKE